MKFGKLIEYNKYIFFKNHAEIEAERLLSRYILLTGQILVPDYLYFLRYWAVCVQYCDIMNFEINLTF